MKIRWKSSKRNAWNATWSERGFDILCQLHERKDGTWRIDVAVTKDPIKTRMTKGPVPQSTLIQTINTITLDLVQRAMHQVEEAMHDMAKAS